MQCSYVNIAVLNILLREIERMSDNIKEKTMSRWTYIYGLIVAVVNYFGFLLANSGEMPVLKTQDYSIWLNFMSEHEVFVTSMSIVAFIIPTFIILVYRRGSKRMDIRRFVNIPFVFSAIGTLGWILAFVFELGCLFWAKTQYDIAVSKILTTSLLNILQESIFIFTLAFLILDFIQRKIVLPKLFPEGHLSRYNVVLKPSVRFIVIVFYLSVCVFPIFFLTTTLITFANNNNCPLNMRLFVVLGCFILFSLVILWAFCDYFNNPLKKLKTGTEKVKEGDYTHNVDIVSNDAFGDLADTFNEMISTLEEKNKRIHAIQNSIIRGMAVMVESRDNSTGGHISRTSDCVKVFAEKLVQTEGYKELPMDFYKAVIKAAPMHDLGKIAVDDAVLRKPGKFTDEEYEKMKKHSSEGARIVESVLAQSDDANFKQIAINVAHYHHEKWNGAGYPEGIAGEDIPLEARIMALADVFDALVSKRCYKESFTYDKAFDIIEESLGSHFDPTLGRIFIECRPELQDLYESY